MCVYGGHLQRCVCGGVVFRMGCAWGSPVCMGVCACVRSPQWMCVCVGGLQGVGVYVGVDASGYIEKKNRSTCSPSDIFS